MGTMMTAEKLKAIARWRARKENVGCTCQASEPDICCQWKADAVGEGRDSGCDCACHDDDERVAA